MTKEYILNYLKDHKEAFRKKYGISKIALFGSFAKDTAKPFSDVDVVIETKTSDYFLLYDLKEDLENAFHTKVDLIRLREKMNASLKRRINEEAIYV